MAFGCLLPKTETRQSEVYVTFKGRIRKTNYMVLDAKHSRSPWLSTVSLRVDPLLSAMCSQRLQSQKLLPIADFATAYFSMIPHTHEAATHLNTA